MPALLQGCSSDLIHLIPDIVNARCMIEPTSSSITGDGDSQAENFKLNGQGFLGWVNIPLTVHGPALEGASMLEILNAACSASRLPFSSFFFLLPCCVAFGLLRLIRVHVPGGDRLVKVVMACQCQINIKKAGHRTWLDEPPSWARWGSGKSVWDSVREPGWLRRMWASRCDDCERDRPFGRSQLNFPWP